LKTEDLKKNEDFMKAEVWSLHRCLESGGKFIERTWLSNKEMPVPIILVMIGCQLIILVLIRGRRTIFVYMHDGTYLPTKGAIYNTFLYCILYYCTTISLQFYQVRVNSIIHTSQSLILSISTGFTWSTSFRILVHKYDFFRVPIVTEVLVD